MKTSWNHVILRSLAPGTPSVPEEEGQIPHHFGLPSWAQLDQSATSHLWILPTSHPLTSFKKLWLTAIGVFNWLVLNTRATRLLKSRRSFLGKDPLQLGDDSYDSWVRNLTPAELPQPPVSLWFSKIQPKHCTEKRMSSGVKELKPANNIGKVQGMSHPLSIPTHKDSWLPVSLNPASMQCQFLSCPRFKQPGPFKWVLFWYGQHGTTHFFPICIHSLPWCKSDSGVPGRVGAKLPNKVESNG